MMEHGHNGSDSGLWLSEEDVSGLLTLEDAIEVLTDAYRLQAAGQATTMSRAHVREGDAILHAVGGVLSGAGATGIKTWTYTPGGASPLLLIFDLGDGSVRGVIQAFSLGQMRTAATAGLATRLLAREDAGSLAVLGTGRQAFSQVQAVAAVRPLREVRVYGRDPARREAMASRVRDELDVAVLQTDQVAVALAGADVATTITRSAEPFVSGEMFHPGLHINAVGAIVGSRRELDESAVGRCGLIVADSVDQAREDAGELRAAVAAGVTDWSRVRALDAIVDSAPGALRGPEDITMFKALGVGVSDVALGVEILRRATEQGVGRPLPKGSPVHH